jgi:hypothetical protein
VINDDELKMMGLFNDSAKMYDIDKDLLYFRDETMEKQDVLQF